MKIRFLTMRFDPAGGGGAHQSLDLKLRALRELGHETSLVTIVAGAKPPADAPYPVRERPVNLRNLLTVAAGVQEVLKELETEADVFHLDGTPLLGGGAQYRAAGGRRPVLCWINSFLFCTDQSRMDGACHRSCGPLSRLLHAPSPAWKKLLGLPLHAERERRLKSYPRHVDAVVYPSPFAREAHERLGIRHPNSHALPEFVDVRGLQERPPGTRPEGFTPGRFHAVYSGRLVREKGVDLLLEAALRLPRELPLTVHVIGDGPDRAWLESKAVPLGDRAVFYGWKPRAEAMTLVSRGDVFVHPSRWPEPLGIAMIEAAAFGTPMLVPAESGAVWLAGEGGVSFRNGDAGDLAEKIRALAGDPGPRARLRERAAARARELDYRLQAPALEALYEGIGSPLPREVPVP